MYDILNNYKDLDQLKRMSFAQLYDFSEELRNFLIEKVSKTGGHLASNLGVVELTLSLYRVFDLDKDKIIWDVGHQTYVHKILTGRKDKFDNLRRHGGISGFPKCCESEYDLFETGHSSTSISAALGMARARDLTNDNYQVVAVIGDGALTGGMALEALNDVGYRKTNLIIVLNDNQMSIGKNVGGLSTYLSKIRIDPKYNKFKFEFNEALRKTNLGNGLADSLKRIKSGIKQILVPGMFFEDMGIKYLGPIDGHNIKEMTKVMSMAKEIKGPVLIHAITKKGKGYIFAENNPDKFHGVSTFDWMTGKTSKSSVKSYSEALGDAMVEIATDDDKVVAITAAMKDGTGLTEFAAKFPKRFFDVGIAEQHAVTLSAGMSKGGLKPVFVVYSTFLQRAYDQVIHDVCQQKLPVVLAIDRAGIVGNDGETHQGVFDLSYLSHMPNITIMSPKSTEELKYMLKWAVNQKYPIAIRYPRGGDNVKIHLEPLNDFTLGKWEVINSVGKVALIATGKMVQVAMEVQQKLRNNGIDTTLVNACFVKPIDKSLLKNLFEQNYKIITIEDNVLHGGLGSLVLEYANLLNYKASITNYGFEDKFISHGDVDVLYKLYGLDSDGLVEKIIKII